MTACFSSRAARLWLCALLVAGLAAPGAPAERGFFGLSLGVDVDDSGATRTLRAVRISKVLTASPAAAAGLRRGDLIVAVEGRAIAGLVAAELDPLMQRAVGKALHLEIDRDGRRFDVTLIAVIARGE